MVGFLGIVALFLLFYIIFKIAKTNELVSVLKGEENNSVYMSKVNGVAMLAFIVIGLIMAVWSSFNLIPLMLPMAASEHGRMTDGLFDTTLIYTGIVFLITQIVLFWFSFKYREREGQKPYYYPHNNNLEVIWTVIPAIVMTVLVVGGMRVWFHIFDRDAMQDETNMVVEVTGKQFNWIVRYPGADGQLGPRIIDKEHVSPENELGIDWEDASSHDDLMVKEIHLVKDQRVLFKLGALDVIHSFYLPHFRVKMDCVPGIPTSFAMIPVMSTKDMQEELSSEKVWQRIDPETGNPRWQEFRYELACAELCGKSHYAMQMDVIVHETEEEYMAWFSKQKPYYETVVKPSLPAKEADELQAMAGH